MGKRWIWSGVMSTDTSRGGGNNMKTEIGIKMTPQKNNEIFKPHQNRLDRTYHKMTQSKPNRLNKTCWEPTYIEMCRGQGKWACEIYWLSLSFMFWWWHFYFCNFQISVLVRTFRVRILCITNCRTFLGTDPSPDPSTKKTASKSRCQLDSHLNLRKLYSPNIKAYN